MIIKNGNVITPFEILRNSDIKIVNDVIKSIGRFGSDGSDDETVIDATNCYVCPGFVDIHTHGGGGGDFMDAEDESFYKALKFHSSKGTTSILASSVTAPVEQIVDMISVIRRFKSMESPACRILGAHLEGPYLSVKNKGAQKEKYLLSPENDSYDFIIENKDVIVNVTISPELPGAAKMVRDLTGCGIVVSGGHDDGRKESIVSAIDTGLTNLTHIFCAMSSVSMKNNIRSVGLTELGLIDDRLSAELIADNHHLPPELVRLAYKCKGADKICIVSDCLRAGGMPKDGTLYTLGKKDVNSQKFIVAEDVALLPDGSRYAGSIQPVGQMVRNLVYDCNIPLVDAICMASYTPARIIHKEHILGSIENGKLADFCIMDKDLNIVKTIVGGRIVYE